VFRIRFAVLASLALLLTLLPTASRPARAQSSDRCFEQTGQCINGRFRSFWEQNGGLSIFGYPISRADLEVNPDTAQTYLTQWFERNRFELHGENPAPYDVLLGRLGADALARQGRDWRAEGREPGPKQGCLWFELTGHNVCDFDAAGASAADRGFLSYWRAEGLADPQLNAYQRSLALHGLPLTAPRMETNSSGDTVLTQWFERARFEWHPNNPAGFRVLLGLLGNELRGAPQPQPTLPSNAPWVHAGNRVVALAEGQPAVVLPSGTPTSGTSNVLGSPDGRFLSYTTSIPSADGPNNRLVVRTIASGFERTIEIGSASIFLGTVWAPDSHSLAVGVINQNSFRWDLRIVDAATGNVRTVLADQAGSVLQPVAWTGEGLFTTRIIWASDAPPLGLQIVDPVSGNVANVIETAHYGVAVSPNGRRAAFVGGLLQPGSFPSTELLVLDRDTGRTATIVQRGAYYIGDVHWSPDSQKLVHSRLVEGAGAPMSLHVTNADGTGEQILPLGPGGVPGSLLDVAWRSGTLQLLMSGLEGQVVVFEVSLGAFSPAQARRIAELASEGSGLDSFVYQPGHGHE